jgi:uncharacterized protein YbjT (DUF2867 family)
MREMLLVVGATGQLGTVVTRKLRQQGKRVRAMVREGSSYTHLKRDGIELCFADLRDSNSLLAACDGIPTVIATANAAVPTATGDSFKAVDGDGYANLIAACLQKSVAHFVYVSAIPSPFDHKIPIFREKRITEQRLVESGLDYTIFRAESFMDLAFAMMGSDIPIRGAEAATIRRPFWFTSRFFNRIKQDIEQKGRANIPGSGTARHSFICIDDVAQFVTRSIELPAARNAIFDLGGPEALSYNDVVAIYEKLLGRRLRVHHTPASFFRIAMEILKPFSPAAADIMGINYLSATQSSEVDMKETAATFGVALTSAEDFLRKRIAVSGAT